MRRRRQCSGVWSTPTALYSARWRPMPHPLGLPPRRQATCFAYHLVFLRLQRPRRPSLPARRAPASSLLHSAFILLHPNFITASSSPASRKRFVLLSSPTYLPIRSVEVDRKLSYQYVYCRFTILCSRCLSPSIQFFSACAH